MRTLTTTLAAVLACATLISAPIAAAATPTDSGIVLNDDSADPTGEAEPTPDQPSPDQALPEAPADSDGAGTDDPAEVVPDPLLDLEPAVEPDAEALTASAETSTGGQISGTITYPDGTPVTSGYACAHDTTTWQGSCTSPQADGTYTFTDLPAGSYRVLANAYGATTTVSTNYNGVTGNWLQYTTVPVTDQTGATDINIQLLAGSTLSGSVRDATTNTPIDGIRIFAYEFVSGSSMRIGWFGDSAKGGNYSIVVPIGITVGVETTTYGPTTGYRAQTYPNLLTMTANPQTGIDFTLTPFTAGTITGTITDNTGTPIPGIEVCAWDTQSQCAFSSADGTYSIVGMEPGSKRVLARDNARPPRWQSQYFPGTTQYGAAVPVDVVGGQILNNIDFTLQASTAGWITGTVTGDNGSPVSGAWVCTSRVDWGLAPGCGWTDSNGTYTLFGAEPGDYFVQVNSTGTWLGEWHENARFRQGATPVNVTQGQGTSVDFQLASFQPGTIAGTVTTASTGQPVQGILVCARFLETYDSAPCTLSDTQGRYTLANLEAGTYVVFSNSTAAYYHLNGGEAVVLAGQTVTGPDLHVEEGGRLSGTVVDASGQPLVSATVCFEGDQLPYQWDFICTSTRANGSWSSYALPAGVYKVWVAQGDIWNDVNARIPFNDGQPVTVTVGEEVSGLTITVPDAGLMASAAEADSAPSAELPWMDPTVGSDPRLLPAAPQS